MTIGLRADAETAVRAAFRHIQFAVVSETKAKAVDAYLNSLERSSRESLCQSSRDWAMDRDAKEALCWFALAQARLELAKGTEIETEDREARKENTTLADSAAFCSNHLEEGLKIARDCGYGLYHIDLLLERARLQLLRGNPQSALADLRLALDDGIPANAQTGQPELLAANAEECGYAWPIPAGLQLRAEALLLQAAQRLGSDSFVPAKQNELPGEMKNLIDAARENLEAAMARWQPLHDPEPERPDQNFQLDGKEHNYCAADTHQVRVQLEGGILTRYLLATDDSPHKKKENCMEIVTDPRLRGDRL